MVWDQIEPCEIYMLVMTVPGTRMWYRALPEKIRRHCHVEDRIPRQELMELLLRSRVMLAPSLVDGIPNSMLEAFAAGAFPIVSPLETISGVVKHEDNVLFARNLYPNEVADAILRAMTDDALVDRAADRNLELVRSIADRSIISPRVIRYYESLVGGQ
jgi:glycosyltransferase involved in cell wall biosynthesis